MQPYYKHTHTSIVASLCLSNAFLIRLWSQLLILSPLICSLVRIFTLWSSLESNGKIRGKLGSQIKLQFNTALSHYTFSKKIDTFLYCVHLNLGNLNETTLLSSGQTTNYNSTLISEYQSKLLYLRAILMTCFFILKNAFYNL